MKKSDFNVIPSNTPKEVPVFEVYTVPQWAEGLVENGEYVYFNERQDSLALVRSGRLIGLKASHVEFVSYVPVDKLSTIG